MDVNTGKPIQPIQQQYKVNQSKELHANVKQANKEKDVAEIKKGVSITADMAVSVVVEKIVEKINESMPQAPISIKDLTELQDYTSPENTAQRIVDFSTKFYSNFLDNHPEIDKEKALEDFYNLMSNAIEKGFGEAYTKLQGFSGYTSDINNIVSETHDLVFKKLSDWYQETLQELLGPPAIKEIEPEIVQDVETPSAPEQGKSIA